VSYASIYNKLCDVKRQFCRNRGRATRKSPKIGAVLQKARRNDVHD
jgi:hypothetical protein